ncbi:MAG: 23S rRNA (guanosine(2251)-2'-O)-methyltransferase RlmB [Actinobacteria bacterium]|nr:23S rRNA (guanosine(2251)-2'-O)-methyltransferase RlmB [Actinomycetota bacterium]MCA1720034.1 23S rRNA (guanosine(2251)-2'-O)-methyltransferase RlmB [Actinomycetota bacterium]
MTEGERGKKIGGGGAGGRAGKPGSHRKGAPVGSGGQNKKRLSGRGPTPPAEARTKHPAARKAAAAARRTAANPRVERSPRPMRRAGEDTMETVVGRNPVVEALRAKVPATALYVALGLDADERVTECVALAGKAGVAILEMTRQEMDKMTGRALHQGLALQVPPYEYLHPSDLLAEALKSPAPLLVALDGVTDPRNLGAVVRSAAAFGAQGVLIPERRSAAMTASAWRTSAGAAARLPVARATNLVRALKELKVGGLFVVGLAADGAVSLDDLEVATDPLVVVVGSEGEGLSRLVAATCDLTVSIPMGGPTESLNAGIAAAVTLAEVARRRRTG